mmetsp:Transcript_14587/g.43755  ORF Transcript_14587/g.43755 Transcript_14587/m.43755 type:complete len:239 (-) Transcript_14587:93-809(-)
MGTGASAPPKKPTLPVPDDVLVIVLGFVSFSSCRDGESEPLLDVVTMRAVCKEWSRLIKRFPRDYLAICGRYYLTRFYTTGQAVACRRPGPASFADARGALVISASRSSSCNHGKLRIKGLADPGGEGEGRVTGRPYETTLVHDGPARGTYMTHGFGYSIRVPPHQNYEQGVGGKFILYPQSIETENPGAPGDPILGFLFFYANLHGRGGQWTTWHEKLRCTRVPPDTPDWPGHLFSQ